MILQFSSIIKKKVTKDNEGHLKEFSWQKAKLVQSVIGVNDYFNLILFWSFIYFRSFEGFFLVFIVIGE